jgi:hypothetical protein
LRDRKKAGRAVINHRIRTALPGARD